MISITALQQNGNNATGVTECDVTFAGTNTAHKQILVLAIWHGATDGVVLTCEDTLHNFYKKDGGAGPIFTGSHAKANMWIVGNGRPGVTAGDCTIKVKSGSDVGDFVVAAVELDGGSGNLVGTGLIGFDEQGIAITDYTLSMGVCGINPALLIGWFASLGTTTGATMDTSGFYSSTGNIPNFETASALGAAGFIWTGEVAGLLGNSESMIFHMVGGSPSAGAAGARFGFTAAAPSPWRGDIPTMSPPTGEYSSNPTVSLSEDIPGLDIYYTTDGTTPDATKTLYTAPFSVTGPTTTVKAIAIDSTGFWADSFVASETYDIYTGTVNNPNNIIDGDDSSYAELICDGAPADVVQVRANLMAGTTGAPGSIKVDFEVTQNDLVAPSQTLPAWKVIAKVGGTETLLASGVVGAGPVARGIVTQAVSPGILASTLAAKIAAICQIPGSTGGVKVRVYAAYLLIP